MESNGYAGYLACPNTLTLNRAFTPNEKTTVLCGDTTYVRVNGVWCYLAIIINLRNRQLIVWQMSRHHDAQLVVDALNQAMLRVKPPITMLFHSDQGSKYLRSKLFTEYVQNMV